VLIPINRKRKEHFSIGFVRTSFQSADPIHFFTLCVICSLTAPECWPGRSPVSRCGKYIQH